MTIHNVRIYREMRLVFGGIEAESPEAAALFARGKPTDEADSIDDCEGENLAALVDLAGDEDYEHSQFIDFEPERIRKAAPAQALMLDLIRYGLLHLADGDLEFAEVVHAFDDQNPDWTAVIDAIGWDTAREALAKVTNGVEEPR